MFGKAGERQTQAACRAHGGFLLAEQRDPWRARDELARAHVDPALAPALAARTALVLAWCNRHMGRTERARHGLAAARRLFDRAPAAGEQTFRSWWEAHIAGDDGQSDQADAELDAVRRRLLSGGSFAEAAHSSLDLLTLRVKNGRLDELSNLGPDLLDAFQCRPWAFPPAAMIDWLALLAARRSADFWPALVPIRDHLSRPTRHPQRGRWRSAFGRHPTWFHYHCGQRGGRCRRLAAGDARLHKRRSSPIPPLWCPS